MHTREGITKYYLCFTWHATHLKVFYHYKNNEVVKLHLKHPQKIILYYHHQRGFHDIESSLVIHFELETHELRISSIQLEQSSNFYFIKVILSSIQLENIYTLHLQLYILPLNQLLFQLRKDYIQKYNIHLEIFPCIFFQA